jgi:hypothetical protein
MEGKVKVIKNGFSKIVNWRISQIGIAHELEIKLVL